MVLLKDGSYKSIVDVQVGDPVQTETGNGDVVAVFSRDVTSDDEVFEIESECGSIVRLTGHHVVPILRQGVRIEVRVDELTMEDELLI